jgi:hypothetical protein
MTDDGIAALGDHQKGCDGRTYTCTCGYDEAQAAEIARLREALRDIAKYDVGLQNLIDDGVYEETETSRYYAMNINWRQKLARAALAQETQT